LAWGEEVIVVSKVFAPDVSASKKQVTEALTPEELIEKMGKKLSRKKNRKKRRK